MYIMVCCAVWARTILCVSGINMPVGTCIIYVHVAVMEIVSVNVFVSVYAIKYGRGSSPNYDSDVSLEF